MRETRENGCNGLRSLFSGKIDSKYNCLLCDDCYTQTCDDIKNIVDGRDHSWKDLICQDSTDVKCDEIKTYLSSPPYAGNGY